MVRSLKKLFLQLNDSSSVAEEICGFIEDEPSFQYEQDDIDFLACYFSGSFNMSMLAKNVRDLFELSVNAFDAIVHAWMSELPVEAEIISFGRRVIASAEKTGDAEMRRLKAEKAACDRTDENTLRVLDAAYKVQVEVHRMTGLLRFSPNEQGCYIAKCEPDHLILPALGDYFTARFGETDWQIIDEKRNLILSRRQGETAKLRKLGEIAFASGGDEWEDLWRHYHKTINNESRYNPKIQRQFMPQRYWKYLPEKS